MTTHTTSAPTTADAAEAPPCWLSVVIPAHNRRELALRAINSVLEQHHPRRIEIIVVDDGSTDGLAEAIHQHHAGNDSVRVITTAREYTNAARNTGFRASCGELVCFLDSDDLWMAHTLTVVEQIFAEHPELAFLSIEGSTLPSPAHPLISRVVAEDAPGWSHAGFRSTALVHQSLTLDGPQRNATLLYGDYFPAIIRGDLFLLSGLIIRRDAIVRAGPFTEHFRFYNDWEFFARMCLQGIGGYIDYDGFRRDAGRVDQISRARPATAMPRRHVYILRTLARRFPARLAAYATLHKDALNDAQYWMARCLLRTHHRRFAKRLLMHSVRQRYKVARSLALLAVANFI